MANTTNKAIESNPLKYLYVLVVLVVLVVFPEKAQAEGLSLGIYPPLIQVQANPPARVETPLALHNFTDTGVTLSIQLKPFTQANSNDGTVTYLKVDDPFLTHVSLRDGQRELKEVTLLPKREKSLTLVVEVPEDEKVQDHSFSIIFLTAAKQEPTLEEKEIRAHSRLVGGIATNVVLTVGPKDKAQGALVEFSSPWIVKSGPVPFRVTVKNTGKNVVNPTGEILLKNMFGQTIGRVDLLPVAILAGTTRSIQDTTASSLESVWNEPLLLGPYSATLTLALSPPGPVLTKTIRFVGVPAYILIGLMTLIVVLSIILSAKAKKRFSRS